MSKIIKMTIDTLMPATGAIAHKVAFMVSLLCLTQFGSAIAQTSSEAPQSAYECTQVSLDDVDESLLTREEKIARLDGALIDSIDSYMSCVNTVQSDMSGNGAGSGQAGGAGAASGSAASAEGSTEGNATSGQEASEVSHNGAPQAGSAPVATPPATGASVPRGVVQPKDNDSIICKLLFAEIQKANPVNLAGLEKQYRDYKCGS